jgi:hypothetical protein
MWHIGKEDVNSGDVRDYVPTLLVKVTEHVYDIMDDNDNICFALLQLEGEEGMKVLRGTYMKYPTDEFLKHCKTNHLFSDGTNNRLDGTEHKVSPHRAATHRQAAKMMDQSARKVMRRVKCKQTLIALGNVIHMPSVQQDRA